VRAHERGGALDLDASMARRRARIGAMSAHALSVCGDGIDDDRWGGAREAVVGLVSAADAFVVRRERVGSAGGGDGSGAREAAGAMSVIAGYPWFSDWGRDTMIALEGLLLVTGRHEEALRVLLAFAGSMRHGLIPNRFDDAGGEAHFNTVDASLWFVHGCARWCAWSGEELPDELVEACWSIVEAYLYGTINAIGVDPSDGLVSAGSASTQLTWMDALRDGVAFTPRHGKAVEINALWIRALRLTAGFVGAHHPERARRLVEHADRARDSMARLFVGGAHGGLMDRLESVGGARGVVFEARGELRPNQVFAASLPGLGFERGFSRRAVDAVGARLWTARGVRTLAPDEPGYCAHYTGTMTDRDRAYHNGTAWQWLLGAYHEGDMRTSGFDDASRVRAAGTMVGLARSMSERSIGSIAEICDAEGAHEDRGCPAQAWSVAEALRVLVLAVNPGGWAGQ
jgi:glycogen debranching enzyme